MGETHQGFTNYATFGVAVTLDNDRKMSDKVRELTFAVIDNAPADENVTATDPQIWTVEECERFRLADALKGYIESLCENGCKLGDAGLMASQMVQAGLAEVDWNDLAVTYLNLAKTEWER